MNTVKALLARIHQPCLVFLLIAAVYGLSCYKRYETYTEWMQNPAETVVEGVTAMSTLDAYWWLKVARDLDAGKLGKGLTDPTKDYPDLAEYPGEASLLPRLISLAKHFTGGDYHRAGLWLVPVLAGLFVFPLFLYLHALGFGPSAILGGLVGSFSLAYYSRSVTGYVDTDLLNLFFPLTVSALIVRIDREKSSRANLLLAVAAGLTMYLFNWWYQQPVFFLAYLLTLAAFLLSDRLPWKRASVLLLVFAIASGPSYLAQSVDSLRAFLAAFFFPLPTGRVVWPDVMATIQETQRHEFLTQLKRLHGCVPLVGLGLAGLLWLYSLRLKRMLPLTPLLAIGVWSLFGPSRFEMYLAPFVGVGLGVLIEMTARFLGRRFRVPAPAVTCAAIASMLVLFFSTIGYTAYQLRSGPVLPAETVRALLDIKRRVPKHSAMLSWWDNGYPLMELGEFATYHDNAAPGQIRSTLIAKALVSPRQEHLAALVSCLEGSGFNRLRSLCVERNLSGEELMSLVFNSPVKIRKDNLYILYTYEMVDPFGYIYEIGTWDFSRKKSEWKGYAILQYVSHGESVIKHAGGSIDLAQGLVTDGTTAVPLLAALFVRDGHVIKRMDFAKREGVYLEVLLAPGQAPRLLVMEGPVFQSSFNQQFLLGNYDPRYFEEVYDAFPVARLFRLKKNVP